MENPRVLVVEDDQIVSDYLKLCLMLMGYTVADVCNRGEEAIKRTRELQPDIILMDIKLKGPMNGLEAAAMIQKEQDVPIIYLTGYGDDDMLQSAKATEPFGYLLKPFRENDLKNVIEIALYRHKIGKELKAREASYRNLAESLPGIVYRLSCEQTTQTRFFNAMLEKMTGYTEDELTSDGLSCLNSLLLPADRPFLQAVLNQAIERSNAFETEYRILHKDGSIRYFLERGKATNPGDGSPPLIDSVILDITERKHSEEKLELAYLRLMERQIFIESILTNIQSGIIVTDLDFRIMLMNPSAEQFLEVSAPEAIGKELKSICNSFYEAIRRNDDSAEISCNDCAREHIIGFKVFDMRGKDNAVNGRIISFADLTEIVKIRKEMKLKERLAAMGEFVARVAHEIRNPLFGMTAICQIFSMELQLNESHKKLMDSMMKEAWRLKRLVEELLDCSREIRIVNKTCDLVKMIDDSLFENQTLLEEKGITIEKHYTYSSLPILADKDKIKQVVINLIRNASEASYKNGTVTIQIDEGHTAQVSLTVSDDGPGIPDNSKEKIFDVFYTTKKHGTGLGLAISKNIMIAHGGSLTVSNRAEGGASFKLTLPGSPAVKIAECPKVINLH